MRSDSAVFKMTTRIETDAFGDIEVWNEHRVFKPVLMMVNRYLQISTGEPRHNGQRPTK